MSRLRDRKYLSEEVATETWDDSPGGEEKSYARESKKFFQQFIKDMAAAIPSSFLEAKKKAKVVVRGGYTEISGEAERFTWSIFAHRRHWGGGIDVTANVSGPKSNSLTFCLNEDASPEDVIQEVVAWMQRKTKKS